MRLDNTSRNIIKNEIITLLGRESVVVLFGSRVDDSRRGGDIDLLVETPQPVKNRVKAECQLTARLYIKLGGRKVDVLIKDSRTPIEPIYQQARLHGVVL